MAVKQLLGGRYQFIKTLGSDVSGGTYLVGDTYLEGHPKCVVKRLPLLGKGPRALQFILLLLEKKAEALKHVGTHEQVPKILAYFEENNNFYLVEEFIPGRPLRDVLKPGKPLSEEVVVQLLTEILKILMVVHSWGVIHRCIKPSNIIQRQSDGKLVLTGFGIFREISAQSSRNPKRYEQRYVSGEEAYLSPDQLKGQRHFNSDIYAVGVIGIQALSGLTAAELTKLRTDEGSNGTAASMQRPWHRVVSAHPSLVAVLDRMTHNNSEFRYQTAAEVLEDVRRLDKVSPPEKAGPPVPVAPPPIPEQFVSLPPNSPQGQKSTRPPARPWVPWGIGLALLFGVGTWLAIARIPQRVLSRFHIRQGVDHLNQGNHQQAIAQFSNALNHRDSGYAYLQRGLAHQKVGDWRLAQEDFSQAITMNPKLSQAYFHRANIRYSVGDRQGALEDYTQAISLDASTIKAYVNRGNIRADLGDERGAIEDYSIAIQRDPSLSSAYLNRCLSRSNIDDHRGAIADCTQAIALAPNSVMAYQNRGLVRRRLGDMPGALEDFNIAINLDPDDPDPYYNRGLARLDLGDRLGAIDDYSAAINLNPNHALAHYDRGIIRAETGDARGAIADFRTSAKLCLDAGRQGCYEDAQYQISQLQQESAQASYASEPEAALWEDTN